jgi:hypothetical protein
MPQKITDGPASLRRLTNPRGLGFKSKDWGDRIVLNLTPQVNTWEAVRLNMLCQAYNSVQAICTFGKNVITYSQVQRIYEQKVCNRDFP